MWAIRLGLLVVLLACPHAARAEGKKQVTDLLQRSRAMLVGKAPPVEPGAWVQYRLNIRAQEGTGPVLAMEVLVKISFPLHVDLENPLPEDAYWMEFEFMQPGDDADAGLLVLKTLIQGDPREPGAVKRMFLGMGGRKPMELGPQWTSAKSTEPALACQRGDAQGCAAAGGKVREAPPAKLYTRLGWLEARKVSIELPNGSTQQVWLCDRIPVLGFAKAQLAHMMDLELEGFGAGALSRIDETQAVLLPDPAVLERDLKSMQKSP
jgi:hypothetical protein